MGNKKYFWNKLHEQLKVNSHTNGYSAVSFISASDSLTHGTKISIFRNRDLQSCTLQWLEGNTCHTQTYFGENHGGNHCTPFSIIGQVGRIPSGGKKLSIAEGNELKLIERVLGWSDFSFLLWREKGWWKLNRSFHNSILKIHNKQKQAKVAVLVCKNQKEYFR